MRDYLLLYVNGKPFQIRGPQAFEPLSSFLRYEMGATGTKVVCAEGDCGACTVLLGKPAEGKLLYKTINSCIQFLCQLDGCHVITVEGLTADGHLHPVQQSMIEHHGAQCGYCTPGIVVSLCSLVCEKRPDCAEDIKDALTGNLCRCTGYEPIIAAGLATNFDKVNSWDHTYNHDQMLPQLDAQTKIPALIEYESRKCFLPVTIEEAVRFKAGHPDTVIISGGTDLCVNANKRSYAPESIMSLCNVSGVDTIRLENGQLAVGARATLGALEDWAREELPELARVMWLFGSPQIRHAGTLVGNIANGSPIADTLPWLFVMEAMIELTGPAGTRAVNINSFYKGYKQLDMKSDEIITGVLVPMPDANETLRLFKVSKRQHLDISTFTAAVRMSIANERIAKVSLAYGGVAPVVLRLPKTESFLTGKEPTPELFQKAGLQAREEIAPISDVRGSRDFRLQLAENILLKFYYESVCEREYACQR